MALTVTESHSVQSPNGNSLAIFIEAQSGKIKLKDVNGIVESLSDYISVSPYRYNVTYPNSIEPILGNNVAFGGCYSSISGGQLNRTTRGFNFIGGGYCNIASGAKSSISGGACNLADGYFSSVVGGCSNTASAYGSNVSGGYGNVSSGGISTISGGFFNTASGIASSVSGGRCNLASGFSSFVGGGIFNKACGTHSLVAGGKFNTSSSLYSTVNGGVGNISSGSTSWIGGGSSNVASGCFYAVVAGGNANTASGCGSLVVGGVANIASGVFSGILGGRFNNTAGFSDAMVIGSCLTATQSCTTFVNRLSADNLTQNCYVKVGANKVLENSPFSPSTKSVGSFYDTSIQSALGIGSPTAMTLNSTDISNNVSVVGGSQITVLNAGIYNLQFSAQLYRASGGTTKTIDIWLRKNGVNVPYSDTVMVFSNNTTYQVAAWNFIVNLAAGGNVQLMYSVQDTDIKIQSEPENLIVPHPAVPSLIVSMTEI